MRPGPADRAVTGGFVLWLAFCTVVALVVLGVGIWAVVKVVIWLTGQAL